MSIVAYTYVWDLKLKGSKFAVMMALAECHNSKTGRCDPGYQTIADMVSMSERQVRRVVRELSDSGLVDVQFGRGRHNTNSYIFTLGDGKSTGDKTGHLASKPDIAMSTFSDKKNRTFNPIKPDISSIKPDISSIKPDIAMSTEPEVEPEVEPYNREVVQLPKKITDKKPAAAHIVERVTGALPYKSQYKSLDEAVGDRQDDLKFFEQVVRGWVLTGYNPKNVGGMIDFYQRREIPGAKRSNGNGRSWTNGSSYSGTREQNKAANAKLGSFNPFAN